MTGMFTRRENIERLDRYEAAIRRLEAKRDPTDSDAEDLDHARVAAAELRDWLEAER